MDLYTFFINHANDLLQLQYKDGSFPSGNNGPYRQKETPIRTTSHAICTLAKAYMWESNKLYKHAAIKAGEYLLHSPYSKEYFVCFEDGVATSGNGTIGQAWAIEALVILYEITFDKTYLNKAISVFIHHNFSKKYNVWYAFDSNTTFLDATFNHQLWFAYSGVRILMNIEHSVIRQRLDSFFENIANIMTITNDGYIEHRIQPIIKKDIRTYGVYLIKDSIKRLFFPDKRSPVLNRGYLSFTLVAWNYVIEHFNFDFASIEENLVPSFELLKDKDFLFQLENNVYTYTYNVFGFEFLYLIGNTAITTDVIGKQINILNSLIEENTKVDYITLQSRIYELYFCTSDELKSVRI